MSLSELPKRLFASYPAKPTFAGLVMEDETAPFDAPIPWERIAFVPPGFVQVIGDDGSYVLTDGRPLRLTIKPERRQRVAWRMQRRRFASLLQDGTLDIEVHAPGTPFRRRTVALVAFVAMSALAGWFVGSVLVLLFGSNPRPLPRALWPVLYGTFGLFAALFGGACLLQRQWAWDAWRRSVASMRFTAWGVTARLDDGTEWSNPWDAALVGGVGPKLLRLRNQHRSRRFATFGPMCPVIVGAARAVHERLSKADRQARRVRDARRLLVMVALLMGIGIAALWWINHNVPGSVPYSAFFVAPVMLVPFAMLALILAGKIGLPRRRRRARLSPPPASR